MNVKKFSKEQVIRIKEQFEKSPDYPSGEYGRWMRARDEAIFFTMRILAVRPREACGIRFSDFDMIKKKVKIRGENNKQRKTRFLPIPSSLIDAYKKISSFSREVFWGDSDFMFVTKHHSRFVSAHRWEAIFREKILKPLGIWKEPKEGSKKPEYSSYTIRHTRATEILDKTKDIFLVMEILGHSSIESTKIYIHLSKEYLQYIREILNINQNVFTKEDLLTLRILSQGGSRIQNNPIELKRELLNQ